MITGVQDIHYNITDRPRAVRFYTAALPMKLVAESEHWVALDCHGVRVGLPPETTLTLVPRDAHGAHGQATLTLKSTNVPEDRRRIEDFGGQILGEADQPWGHRLVFTDPDGNVLKLMNPKAADLDA